MPLDPSAQKLLDQIRALNPPAMDTLPLAEARAAFARSRKALSPEPAPVASVGELNFPSHGHAIRARLYHGQGAPEVAPAVLFFHGGGWVLGDIDTHDPFCRVLANAAQCAVLSVDYRRAPEHKFPAAADDAVAAVDWALANADTLRLDRSRIAVAGDSAGGNLAAVAALERRGLKLQVLIYPTVDLGLGHDSVRRVGEGYTLTAAAMRWFRDLYLARAEDAADWRASPLRASDFAKAPPAFVITAGHDPLCDEGADYARRLAAAGVAVTHRPYHGQMHGFIGAGRVLPEALQATAEIAQALQAAFRR